MKEEKNMKNNYLLVHGSFGSPFSNWIPWLRKEIESKNLDVYTPDFPTGVGFQNYENWSKLLMTYVDSNLVNENTVIFAHSIAPVFVCKFLIEKKIKVKRLVFVCGFNHYFGIDEAYDTVNKSMYLDNLSDIKNCCDDIICLYTDNDPYVAYEAEKEFADTITQNQVLIPGGGHLNSESGYDKFYELLKYVEE